MKDGKGKERKLSEAERQRLSRLEAISKDLVAQGYRRTDLTISIALANVVAIAATALLFVVGILLFHVVHPETAPVLTSKELIVYLVLYLVLIVVHELVHGLTWSRFTPAGFKDVNFGIMRDSLTPYCTCNVPLRKGPYVLGALMPLALLGIVPLVAAFCLGSVFLLYLGILMTVSAVGDIMLVVALLRHKSVSDDMLLYDHPTEAGSVVFER